MKMTYPRLKKQYLEDIRPSLHKDLGLKSIMEVPKIEKICINQGVGAAVGNSKLLETSMEELTLIAGQKPVYKKAKKSISNFKLREGMNIGVMVTLRGRNMYEFLDRFVNISLPRVRDFRGLEKNCFDGNGNCTIGVREQIIFPEISIDKVNRLTGMNVTIVTNSGNDENSRKLLRLLGVPFKK